MIDQRNEAFSKTVLRDGSDVIIRRLYEEDRAALDGAVGEGELERLLLGQEDLARRGGRGRRPPLSRG